MTEDSLKYHTKGEIREEIAYEVGSDPTRYGAGSESGLKKEDVAQVATQLQPSDDETDIRTCTLEELYVLVCGWVGGEYQPTAGNQWGLNRVNLKKIHRALDTSSG